MSAILPGCGLLLDADPPQQTSADGGAMGGDCLRNRDCTGCAVCVGGACVPAEGQPCTPSGRCFTGTYVCESGAVRCNADDRLPAAAGTTCREARNECDAAEACDGMSDACPDDVYAPSGTTCTDGTCDGTGECRSDVCTPGAPCDTGNPCELGVVLCTDGTRRCVAREYAPAGTVCRDARDVCDHAETCDGMSPACPDDTLLGTDVVCRDAATECDIADRCTGMSESCGPDLHTTIGAPCATGYCQNDGTCGACLAGEPCDTGNPCELAMVACGKDGVPRCEGTGVPAPADTVCGPILGPCDVEERCGGEMVCPTDMHLPATTICRTSTVDCYGDAVCTGISPDCPANPPETGTGCGGGAGTCSAGVCLMVAPSCIAGVPGTPCSPCDPAGAIWGCSAGGSCVPVGMSAPGTCLPAEFCCDTGCNTASCF
jgi:hypothetical protein